MGVGRAWGEGEGGRREAGPGERVGGGGREWWYYGGIKREM